MQILALSRVLFVSEGGAAGSHSGITLTRYLFIFYSVTDVIYHQASRCLSLSFNYPTDTNTHRNTHGGKLSDWILETEPVCHFSPSLPGRWPAVPGKSWHNQPRGHVHLDLVDK